MSYRQIDLRSDDHRLTCWLADDQRLRIGSLLTLKGQGERVWEVMRISQVKLDAPPTTRWQVGGLL